MNKKQKEKQLKNHPNCYVCEKLGLSNADFAGYEPSNINFDHWKPKGLIGKDQSKLIENQVPIHAHVEGASYLDDNFESSAIRNCHKGKGNRYESGTDWVEAVKIWRSALKIQYSDDLLPKRNKNSSTYKVTVDWKDNTGHVHFRGDKYPMMIQKTVHEKKDYKWRSFSTVVPNVLLFKDDKVQSRPVDQKRVAEMAIHLRKNPLLSPILCRLSKGILNVFDGNHRLCAFILARPKDPVPVTIFEGPDPKIFLEVVGKAHDELTKQKYQYTAKALKYSALNEDELKIATKKYGKNASEKLAWQGKTSQECKLRIVGKITSELDNLGGWREKWKDLGLTDKSWNEFLSLYAKMTPESEPFSSKKYYRNHELQNLEYLCEVFDDELFNMLGKHPAAKASLKTKWWKMAHKRFHTKLSQVVRDSLKLPGTPSHPAYVEKEWDVYIKKMLRKGAKNWTESPAWREKTVANNEPEVLDHLTEYGFTENYLM